MPEEATQPTLVLDLDGTLVDTAADLVATLNAILATEGVPAVPLDEALPMVGHGSRALLERSLAAAGRDTSDDRLDALTARFISYYGDHIAESSRPFPGVAEALRRFTADGWRLAVCTNKFEGLSRSLLSKLSLANRFDIIAGQDTFAFRKPDPRHLIETIRRSGGDERFAVMVGDSEVDVATAKAAFVPVIAVTFGYSTLPAEELGADAVIDHFDDLFQAARALLPGAGDDPAGKH